MCFPELPKWYKDYKEILGRQVRVDGVKYDLI